MAIDLNMAMDMVAIKATVTVKAMVTIPATIEDIQKIDFRRQKHEIIYHSG